MSTNVLARRVSVGTTHTKLNYSPSQQASGRLHRHLIRVPSGAGASVFIGGSNVTTSTGLELAPGESVSVVLERDEDIFGIVASSTETVHVLSTGV